MAESNRPGRVLATAFAAGLCVVGFSAGVAPAQQLQTLRGKVGLEEINPAPEVLNQQAPGDGMFNRAYRQQPPLIPHRIDGHQITKDFNQCLTCHDWPANTKAGAPKASETHYSDREGNRLDKISGARFFCTQCHVPQTNAKPLITNTFQNASELK